MKKFFLTTLAFYTMSSFFNVSAQAPLPFPQEEVRWNYIVFQYFSPEIGHNFGHPHAPVKSPLVAQEGHVLHFLDGTELALNIIDICEEGGETTEYTSLVSAETEEVQLPATLSGTYTIEVVRGSQHFRSEIEL
ncbi:MAG: hypothetical protein IJ615_07490 [Bacteroidaceae bacterium]|nr:hypothetical protein [Bacteroidaceae bacterium]